MIFEHEIPSGSRLYFGQSAKIKREIESIASETLEMLGFEEIVTPLFSYHQHECFEDQSRAEEFMMKLSEDVQSFTPLIAQRCVLSGWKRADAQPEIAMWHGRTEN